MVDSPKAENKSENTALGLGCLFVLSLLGAGLLWIHNTVWGEREGSIQTDDCRARILIKENSCETWFKKFTCTYQRTKGGKLISGTCEAVDTDAAGKCETVYFYEKKNPLSCTSPLEPYLGDDDLCHDTPQ
jgi:hypothetical protein